MPDITVQLRQSPKSKAYVLYCCCGHRYESARFLSHLQRQHAMSTQEAHDCRRQAREAFNVYRKSIAPAANVMPKEGERCIRCQKFVSLYTRPAHPRCQTCDVLIHNEECKRKQCHWCHSGERSRYGMLQQLANGRYRNETLYVPASRDCPAPAVF